MRDTITVSLPARIRSEVDAFAEQHGLGRSEVVRDALQEYLFFRRSHELRARMVAEAQAQGLFTDEDIFERIS
jgi:metal-responsive CopG/Arc/MetJ family transcriptional regulator